MKSIYPSMILLATFALLALWVWVGIGRPDDVRVPISEEEVRAEYAYSEEVFENCPIEKAERDTTTNEIIVSVPREEYRSLRDHLEYTGWQEQGEESGEFHLGGATIVVTHGEVTLLPQEAQGWEQR